MKQRVLFWLFAAALMAFVAPGTSLAGQDSIIRSVKLTLTADGSGTTTVASGTSYFVITPGGYGYTYPVNKLDGVFTIQLDGSSGVTPSEGNAPAGPTAGWESGVSMNVFYQVSNVDSAEAWSAASRYYIPGLNGILMSGNTLYVNQVDDAPYGQFMRWGFVGGITSFGTATFDMQMR